MRDNTFIFKGKRGNSKGIELREPIRISAAVPKVDAVSVPGRNGDLHFYDGTYENRRIEMRCFLLTYEVERSRNDINAWLIGEKGYFRFEDTEDSKHFMLARARQGLEKEVRAGLLNPFDLEFDAKPQLFLKSGERALDVTSTMVVHNPTAYTALPILEIEGSGDITISLGGGVLYIYDLDGTLIYDAESDNAYYGDINLNFKVGSQGVPCITPGYNNITGSGSITSLKITPRWWEI